jgi:hypothetical protein
MKLTTATLVTTSVFAFSAVSATAAVIASTDFNGRLISTANTATHLGWTANGVDDPGDLAAFQWGGLAQPLFNISSLVQNLFVPGLNVGNAGNDDTRSWTTTVALTVLTGYSVTLESVSFDYWAVNGGQAQNVPRNSDFIATLFSPTMAALGEVSLSDVLNGGVPGFGTPVLLTFPSAIALTEPGTYSLRIRGGDIDNNETGNHTGIDNLSINGVVVPEPSAFGLLGLGLLGLAARRSRT